MKRKGEKRREGKEKGRMRRGKLHLSFLALSFLASSYYSIAQKSTVHSLRELDSFCFLLLNICIRYLIYMQL